MSRADKILNEGHLSIAQVKKDCARRWELYKKAGGALSLRHGKPPDFKLLSSAELKEIKNIKASLQVVKKNSPNPGQHRYGEIEDVTSYPGEVMVRWQDGGSGTEDISRLESR